MNHIILLYKITSFPWMSHAVYWKLNVFLYKKEGACVNTAAKYLISINFLQFTVYVIFFLSYSLAPIPFPSTLFWPIFDLIPLTIPVKTLAYTEIQSGPSSTVFWVTQSLCIFKTLGVEKHAPENLKAQWCINKYRCSLPKIYQPTRRHSKYEW